MQDQVESRRASRPLLRGVVVVLALAEIGVAVYLCYALFFDDTTSWIGLLLSDANTLWQLLVLPFAGAGLVALIIGWADRLLWLGLVVIVAAPVITVTSLMSAMS